MIYEHLHNIPIVCGHSNVLYLYIYFLQNQDDSCIIDDVCYAKHKTNPTDVCSVCLPDRSNNTWSTSNGILEFLFRLPYYNVGQILSVIQ